MLVSAFLGWGLFHRTRERRTPSSNTKPLLNFEDKKHTAMKVDSDFFTKYSEGYTNPSFFFLSQLLELKTILSFHYQHQIMLYGAKLV